jgi:hypothetical protein
LEECFQNKKLSQQNKEMVSIAIFKDEDKQELISFLSSSGFMESSCDSSESVIASVIEYQDKTNNYGVIRGVLLKNETNKIVGFLGALAFPILHNGEQVIGVQTSSANISSQYPGNFKKMLSFYHDQTKDFIRYSIFPVPKIFSSFENYNYQVLSNSTYTKQYYRIINSYSFLNEILKNRKALRPFIFMSSFLLKKRFKSNLNNEFNGAAMQSVNNDYSLIEQDYRKRNQDLIRPVWNQNILYLKFGNKLRSNNFILKENEAIHICCLNGKKEIVGSLFAKKIRGLKRLIISDIQTTNNNYESIVIELLLTLEAEIKSLKYNSYMIMGIDEQYLEFIQSLNITWKKSIDLRTYILPNQELAKKKFKIVYSDDDVNF